MAIPRRLWRFWTAEAIDKLATRFGLPNEPGMQDWAYEVADYERIDEYLAAYESGELSDDERFCLMDMILQAFGFDEFDPPSKRWLHTLNLLEQNIELHAYTICYWACPDLRDDELEELAFEQAPFMRDILRRHREFFGYPFPEEPEGEST